MSELVHRSDKRVPVGDCELLLPGLAIQCESDRAAPASSAGPLDGNRVVRQIRVPLVAVSVLCAVYRVTTIVLALLKTNGMTGGCTSFSTEVPKEYG